LKNKDINVYQDARSHTIGIELGCVE
jgi:hypothetical protein